MEAPERQRMRLVNGAGGAGDRSKCSHELQVCAASVRRPRFEALLCVELVGEVNIRFTVQQVTKVYSRALQMDSVDLEITPIDRPVGIVMINLALAPRIFSPLDRQRSAARRTEFIASVLLIRREPVAPLVGLSLTCLPRGLGH